MLNFKSNSPQNNAESAANKSSGKSFGLTDNRSQSILQKKQVDALLNKKPDESKKNIETTEVVQMKRIRGGGRTRERVRARNAREAGKELADELRKVKKIAATIREKKDYDCDAWAEIFQGKLRAANLPFIPKVILIRPNKNLNANAGGAEIHYAGPQRPFKGNNVGHDSHIYTVVEIAGKRYSFDNINPRGVEEAEHKKKTSIYLDNGAKFDAKLVKQNKSKHLIEEEIPAEVLRDNILGAIRAKQNLGVPRKRVVAKKPVAESRFAAFRRAQAAKQAE